eukprot:GHRQ01014652.1.p1 GENE.GHRQ01014652.1~~GHRQ01014652.1.p1  ORF type:complete len:219 (+),score=55.65 GHRQ01014652.1:723-1379(+)
MTVIPAPAWPPGNEQPKVLLHVLVHCSVDALWEDFFGSYPEIQAKLHKQRHDSNCAESPWVSQRSELPAQQFLWPVPPAGADPGSPAQGKCRKVRFEAAASLASKAFSSEEVQVREHSICSSGCCRQARQAPTYRQRTGLAALAVQANDSRAVEPFPTAATSSSATSSMDCVHTALPHQQNHSSCHVPIVELRHCSRPAACRAEHPGVCTGQQLPGAG